MSIYDTFDGVQIKCGPCEMHDYSLGQKVPLLDGVYLGNEGAIVILHGVLMASFVDVRDKWGNLLDSDALIRPNHP